MNAPGWEGILDADEEIVWQGRPDSRIVWKAKNIVLVAFGLTFAIFALFWMVLAASAGGYFWMFGLIHFVVGISLGTGAVFFDAFKRKRSWYTLTNRRAFIALNLPIKGKSLKSYPINNDTVLEFIDHDPATVLFATERKRRKSSTYAVGVGFEQIENGRDVYAKFREVQKNAA